MAPEPSVSLVTPLGYIFAIEPPCWVCRRPSEVSVTKPVKPA